MIGMFLCILNAMKKRELFSDPLKFLMIALLLLVGLRVFVAAQNHQDVPDSMIALQEQVAENVVLAPVKTNHTIRNAIEDTPKLEQIKLISLQHDFPYPDPVQNSFKNQTFNTPKAIKKNPQNIPPKIHKGPFEVAIIIDDMGMSRKWTQAVIDIDEPLTLAFLPYAERLEEFTIPAKEKGHELIIHTPMEPMNPDLDMGDISLHTHLNYEEFTDTLSKQVFPSFAGYVGINNHMGSKLTQDPRAMSWLMRELKDRNLFFVDSKTIHTSVAAKVAAEYDVPFAERDVFLDHYDDYDKIMASLRRLERTAYKNGSAIAIGHPKENTIKALIDWLPSIKKKGIKIVPVSNLLIYPDKNKIANSSVLH